MGPSLDPSKKAKIVLSDPVSVAPIDPTKKEPENAIFDIFEKKSNGDLYFVEEEQDGIVGEKERQKSPQEPPEDLPGKWDDEEEDEEKGKPWFLVGPANRGRKVFDNVITFFIVK